MVGAVHSCIVYGDWVIRLPTVIRQCGSEAQYVPDDCYTHTHTREDQMGRTIGPLHRLDYLPAP